MNERSTYLDHAITSAEEEAQGRFKKQTLTTVIGVGTSAYPRLPNGPWGSPDPTGAEPPLGIDVNELTPIGGASPALAVTPSVETTAPPERGGLSAASTDNPPPPNKDRETIDE
jgi:hypothetical protein